MWVERYSPYDIIHFLQSIKISILDVWWSHYPLYQGLLVDYLRRKTMEIVLLINASSP